MKAPILLVLALCAAAAITLPLWPRSQAQQTTASPNLKFEGEKHLANIKQLTFEGENAEAYFSRDGKKLIFQRAVKGDGCDQIFSINIDGTGMKMLSNGEGKTTCSYFTPDGKSAVVVAEARHRARRTGRQFVEQPGGDALGSQTGQGRQDLCGGKLSQARAESVRKFLASGYGIARIETRGRGSAQLKDKSDPGNEINRRIEFVTQ